MVKKLNQNFSFKFSGSIWNMVLDEEEALLVLEIRETSSHKTYFAVLDLQNGNLIGNEIGFEEDWWIGMSAIKRGSVLFYTYESDQNPVPASYFLYSLKKQKILWESSEFQLISVLDEGILGYTNSDKSIQKVLIHPVTGILQPIDSTMKDLLKNRNDISFPENKISYHPFHYLEETDYFKLVEEYLVQNHGIKPVKALDYLEMGNVIIISYYLYSDVPQRDDLKFDNYLLILSKNGNQLLLERIDENLSGIGLGTFFVIKNQLIFSRNKSELISYQINYE